MVILVNSVDMYAAIEELRWFIKDERSVEVHTKYKTIDKEVKHVVDPLRDDNWQWTKRVVIDTTLQDPRGIGHQFTDETRRKFWIGKCGFLFPNEVSRFKRMLENLEKAFDFSPNEIGCVDPAIVEPMVILWYRRYHGTSIQSQCRELTSQS